MTRSTQHHGLTRTQLSDLSEQLEEQRRFRVEQLAQLAAEFDEVETSAEREVREAIQYGARVALADILAARERLADGTYGRCVACAAPLSPDRLEVLPHAARCVDCQRGAG